MFRPVKSRKGKLLFKWDKKKRTLQVQRKNEVEYFQISADGEIEPVIPPPINREREK